MFTTTINDSAKSKLFTKLSNKRLKSVFDNIALKINGKLGGKNCELAKNELNFKGIEPVSKKIFFFFEKLYIYIYI